MLRNSWPSSNVSSMCRSRAPASVPHAPEQTSAARSRTASRTTGGNATPAGCARPKTVLGILAAVAGIALAIVAAIATAPLWLVVLAVGLALFTLAISLGLAVKADGSWVDVGFDAVALLSLGTGSFASWLAARTFPAVRSAVAGIRAQRAQRAIDTANSPLRWLRRIASNSHAPSGEQAAARALLAEVTTKARAAATAARSATFAPFPVTRVQRLIDGGLGPSRIARQAREMLLDLRTMPGPPIDPVVLRSARNLVLQSTVGIVATNVGAVFQMADLIRDIRGGLSDGGVFQVATDVVVRLR